MAGTGSGVLLAMLLGCGSSSLHGTAGSGGTTSGAHGSGGVAGAVGGSAGSSVVPADSGGAGGGSNASASGGGTLGSSDGPSAATCNPASAYLCTGTAPPSDLISDFSIPAGSTDPTVFGPWGASVTGGAYAYPMASTAPCNSASDYPIASSVRDGVWNISGTVGAYSGMGIWWMCKTGVNGEMALADYASNCVLDASAYTGISFTVSGDAGPKGGVTFQVTTPATSKVALDYAGDPKACGTCTADPCGTTISVPVTATPTTVSFTWAELGVTETNAIEMIAFALADPCNYSTGRCVPTPYAANLDIDDLKFTH